MKSIFYILFIFILLAFSGCNNEIEETSQPLNCGEYKSGESFKDDCNTCSCSNGNIACTKIACNVKEPKKTNTSFIQDIQNEIKFNSDLTSYESQWLSYLEQKYSNSKIYHIKTNQINCKDCYELSFKKDRNVIKIKVLNGKLSQETTSTDLAVDIENSDICALFSGEWNECPKLCPTDEERCQTECGLPVCEFDENKIVLNQEGEICGGIEHGDCEYGLKCFYENQENKFGICMKK